MNKLINTTSFWVLIGAWFLLQLIQSMGTPIHYDEAYYWMFSKQLAFGYFDHPPAIALLIRASDTVFNGILGVRFFSIIAQLVGLYFLWQMVEDKTEKKVPFVLLVFCLPFFHILGFISTPDVPLLLSAVFFFFTYRQALAKNDWVSHLFWGISMAALLYSKYHGVLLIFFILLSNPRLFLNPKTYFAGVVGLLLWSPHVYWQYLYDFPSFRYHLQERAGNFQWYYPLEYLGNALLIFNPILIWLWVKILKIKTQGDFERGLQFTFFGFLIFFTFQSFRDHVQPQWVVLCYIPLLLLFLNRWNADWNKKLTTSFWISLPLLLAFRILLVTDVLPQDLGVHRHERVMQDVSKLALNKPVMFINSYKSAALYSWYSDQKYTHSYNTYTNRKNQFNIWKMDSTFIGEKVLLLGANYKELKGTKIPWRKKDSIYGSQQSYSAYEKLQFELIHNAGGNYGLRIYNPYEIPVDLGKNKIRIHTELFDGKNRVGRLQLLKIKDQTIPAKGTLEIEAIDFKIPKEKAVSHVGFCASKSPWPPSSIMRKYSLEE